jgi:hypothetical protein
MRHALVIADSSRTRLLLTTSAGGWALPTVAVGRSHPGAVDGVVRAVRRRYGLETHVLRCLVRPRGTRPGARAFVLELELLGESPPRPARLQWVPLADLPRLRARRRGDGDALVRWRAARRRSPTRPEWARPGWRARALRWVERRLGTAVTDVEQLRAWEFSCVLRLTTSRGVFYLKAAAPFCDHEPRVTRWLGRRFPALIAPVVALDASQRWLLTRAVLGPTLRECPRLGPWESTAAAYGRMQRALAGHGRTLRALGCRRRDLAWLAREIPELVHDPRVLAAGGRQRLKPREVSRLRRLVPTLVARCRQLEAGGVAATLDHADLWAINVVVGRHGPVVLDWEDAAVAHPFWSVFLLMWSHGFHDRWGPRGAAARRVQHAYLAGWSGHEGTEQYRRTFALAQLLAPLHYAATWRRDVLPLVETSLETAGLVPFFLRRLLANAERLVRWGDAAAVLE